MYIIEMAGGIQREVAVEPVTKKDFEIIRKLGQFGFDWENHGGETVYKLVPTGTNDMEGLMALMDHPGQGYRFTEIKLIESAKHNVAPGKKYDRVAGTLISFACREAFNCGYDGTVFLIPKTELSRVYVGKYGFKDAGRGLYLDTDSSLKIMAEYL